MATWRHCVLGTMKPTAIVITLEKTNPKATAVLVVRFSAMGLCTKTSLCHPGLTKNDRERLPPNSHLHRRPVRPVRSAVSPQRRGHNATVTRARSAVPARGGSTGSYGFHSFCQLTIFQARADKSKDASDLPNQ